MIRFFRKSFQRRQLACFLAVALLPLLITSLFLTSIVRVKVESDHEKEIAEQAGKVDAALMEAFDSIEKAADEICGNSKIVSTIDETDIIVRNQAYEAFFNETRSLWQYARFDLYNTEGECVYSTGKKTSGEHLPLYWGILRAADTAQDTLVYLREEGGGDILLRGARPLTNADGVRSGYVVISMNADNFWEMLKGVWAGQEGVILLDSHWQVIFIGGMAEEESFGVRLRERLMSGESLQANRAVDGIHISPLGDTGMYKVLLRTEVFSTNVVRTMYTVSLVMAVFCFLLCVVMAQRMSKSLAFPIRRINNAMHKLQEGELNTRIPVDCQDELGEMSENFNIMASRLEEYVERQVKAQQELNSSYIAMMQAQTNPHFLYNTLDTMKWLAKANHVPEIATMSAGLAGILRTSISSEQFISLKEEMQLVTNYVQIQKIRYSDNFRFEMIVPEYLEECIVPKLVVQPIVENALLHGLEGCENGSISVTVSEREEVLWIQVVDNGCGIDEEIMECLNSRDRERLVGHIGFYNVDAIIRLHYGEEYGLYVSRPDEGGTLVRITIPVRWE